MNQQLASRIQSAVDDQANAATAPTIRAVHARASHLRNRRRAMAGAAALPVLAGMSIAVVKQLGHESPTVAVKPDSTRTDTKQPSWTFHPDDVAGHGFISTAVPDDLRAVTVRPWGYSYDPMPLGSEPGPKSYVTHVSLPGGRNLLMRTGVIDETLVEVGEWTTPDYLYIVEKIDGWAVTLEGHGENPPFTGDELRNFLTNSTSASPVDGHPVLNIPGATTVYDGDRYHVVHDRAASITWQTGSSDPRRALSITTMDGAAVGYMELMKVENPSAEIRATPIGDALMDDDGAEGNHITIAMSDAAVGERLVTVAATGLTAEEIDRVLEGLRASTAGDIESLAATAAQHPLNQSIPVYRVDLRRDGTNQPGPRPETIIELPESAAIGINRFTKACATPSRDLERWVLSPTPGFIKNDDDCTRWAANFAVRLPNIQFRNGTSGPAILLAAASPGPTNIPIEVKSSDGLHAVSAIESPRFNSGLDGFDLFVLVGDIDQAGLEISMWGVPFPIRAAPDMTMPNTAQSPTTEVRTTEQETSTTAATSSSVVSTTTSATTATSAATTAASTTVEPSSTVTTTPTTTATTTPPTTGVTTTEAAVTPSSIVVSTTAPAATATTG